MLVNIFKFFFLLFIREIKMSFKDLILIECCTVGCFIFVISVPLYNELLFIYFYFLRYFIYCFYFLFDNLNKNYKFIFNLLLEKKAIKYYILIKFKNLSSEKEKKWKKTIIPII